METRYSSPRNGTIDGEAVVFRIKGTFNGKNMCGAEGIVDKPSEIHARLAGATARLVDGLTKNEYAIFVTPERFSFMDGYANVDVLV